MKQKNINIIIILLSIFIIAGLALIIIYGITDPQEAIKTNLGEDAVGYCEHEFEYRFSTSGSPCIKCGSYCCPHEHTKWVGGVVNTLVCQDCGKAE